jgi:hypothetical protein
MIDDDLIYYFLFFFLLFFFLSLFCVRVHAQETMAEREKMTREPSVALVCWSQLIRIRESERDWQNTTQDEREKNIEIKKSDRGNVKVSGCRRRLALPALSDESIC